MNADNFARVHLFRQKWQGKVMDHNGDLGYNYDECVDVPNMWAKFIEIPESYGNAKDLDFSASCDFVPNNPTNVPSAGDVLIWNGYPADPQYGHTAVALHGCNVNRLRALSQNWPDGSAVHVVIFTYAGVSGWWHPRGAAHLA